MSFLLHKIYRKKLQLYKVNIFNHVIVEDGTQEINIEMNTVNAYGHKSGFFCYGTIVMKLFIKTATGRRLSKVSSYEIHMLRYFYHKGIHINEWTIPLKCIQHVELP